MHFVVKVWNEKNKAHTENKYLDKRVILVHRRWRDVLSKIVVLLFFTDSDSLLPVAPSSLDHLAIGLRQPSTPMTLRILPCT